MSSPGETRVVQRALSLLRILRTGGGPLPLVQIAERANLSRATTLRLLRDLERNDLIRCSSETGRYSLGYGLLELAAALWESHGILELARPFIEELRQETGQTAALSVRVGLRHVTAISLESTQAVRAQYRVGRAAALHIGAAGRAILAYSSPEVVQRVLSGPLDRPNPRVIGHPEELLAELGAVRSRGFAVSQGERTTGLTALAVPVIGAGGFAEAATVVVSPLGLTGSEPDASSDFVEATKRVAKEFSNLLAASRLSLEGSMAIDDLPYGDGGKSFGSDQAQFQTEQPSLAR